MGYITTFNGYVKFGNKEVCRGIKKLLDKMIKDGELWQDNVNYYNDEYKIYIGVEWKNYLNDFEMLCWIFANADKKATGSFNCRGEEDDDIWRIEIKNGKVIIKRIDDDWKNITKRIFNIKNYCDYHTHYTEKECEKAVLKTKKELYNITKDDELLKEIMVEEI